MLITDIISITELSRITGKSRPTLYKYINDYALGRLDEIPYSFIVLFKMISENNISKTDILDYCKKTYATKLCYDEELTEIFSFIEKNRNKLDLSKIKKTIEELLKND